MDFSPGLNVMIGSRGTGKTSVIELLRYCLDATAFTREAQDSARKHAAEVLGSGRVVVTVKIDGETISVARSIGDEAPRLSRTVPLSGVTVLSQNEIEQIGLDSGGRLRIIDEYAPQTASQKRKEQQFLERVRSLSTELRRLTTDREALKETLSTLAKAQADLLAAQKEAATLVSSLEEKKSEQEDLEALGETNNLLAARHTVLEGVLEDLQHWTQRLRDVVIVIPSIPEWPARDENGDRLSSVRESVSRAEKLLRKAIETSVRAAEATQSVEAENREERATVSDQARQLRRLLDAVVKGAGAASARVASLQERLGSLEPSQRRFEELKGRIAQVQRERLQALDQLDTQREKKFDRRMETARSLNNLLGPRIDVRLIRYGRQERYAAAIAEALRGTRLHYNTLAPVLARSLSPRELVEAAETDDVATVAAITQVDEDRVARILDAIRLEGGAAILAAPLEDAAELRLLDGDDYKDSRKLSTGQRCTVVLPLLLEQRGRALVIDQPEDHLDNRFITETVVLAIHSRPSEDQLIVATHNANIPVLGDAAHVFVMGSDGTNGYVNEDGPLDTPVIVAAITRIMEGGWEAFEKRREFYRAHGF